MDACYEDGEGQQGREGFSKCLGEEGKEMVKEKIDRGRERERERKLAPLKASWALGVGSVI